MTVTPKPALKASIAASSAGSLLGGSILTNIVDSYKDFGDVPTGVVTVINVKDPQYGATGTFNRPQFGGGTGGIDDTAAFQAAINAAATLNPLIGQGGLVYVPPGNYLLKGGITLPTYVRLVGASQASVNLFDGGYNLAPVVTMTGTKCSIENMTIYGCGMSSAYFGGTNDPYPAYPAVLVANNNQDGCVLSHVTLKFGNPTLQCLTQDVVLDNCDATYGYGLGIVQISSQGQIWAHRSSFDQAWPAGLPIGPKPFPSVWAAATAHAVGDVVYNAAQDQYLQAMSTTGDTKTGSVAPSKLLFGTNFVDNHVTWQLGLSKNAVIIDTTTGCETYFDKCDFSGAYIDCIHVSATGGVVLGVHNSVLSQQVAAALFLGGTNPSGSSIISGNEIFAGWGSGFGLWMPSTASSLIRVINNSIDCNGSRGIQFDTPNTELIVQGNNFSNAGDTNFFAAAGCGNFIINGNFLDSGTNAVLITAGTSDFYNITNNIVYTFPITDGGTGLNKTISGNH